MQLKSKLAKATGTVPAAKVQDNHFAMAAIKAANLLQRSINPINQKRSIFAAASIAAMA